MTKLFDDKEIFVKERPVKLTDKQIKEMCAVIADEIISNAWSKSEKGDIIEDIDWISFNDSGYEIAKGLESNGDASYDIDTSFIEFLDGLTWTKGDILNNNVKDWVKAHDPESKYCLDSKLAINTPLNALMVTGEIYVRGFQKELACYLVSYDPKEQGGSVIPYEKIESNCSLIK